MALIILCGIKHSGKSTMGRGLSHEFGIPFYDADALVEEKLPEGMSVRDFYRENGKDAFRALEKEAIEDFLKSLDGKNNGVLSLGGGASDNPSLWPLLKEAGLIIYLRLTEEELFERIMRKGLPAFLDPENPKGSFHEIFVRRDRFYAENAGVCVNLDGSWTKTESLVFVSDILEKREKNGEHFR